MAVEEAPGAVTVLCPGCGEQSFHTVLRGRQSRGGAWVTLDATVQCTECERVHHVVVKEPAPVDVPVVISRGQESRRTHVALGADDEIEIGEALIVDGMNCKITGIEDKERRRADAAAVKDVATLWTKEFEELAIKFAINMGHKTISKVVAAKPQESFTIGQEHLFGRLRVSIHAIKTEDRMLKRGTAEAGEIVRVFASPTTLARKGHRPDKRTREMLREREDR